MLEALYCLGRVFRLFTETSYKSGLWSTWNHYNISINHRTVIEMWDNMDKAERSYARTSSPKEWLINGTVYPSES